MASKKKPKKPARKKPARPRKASKPRVRKKKPGSARTVPSSALDRALEAATIAGVMRRLAPPVQPMVTVLRRVLLEAAPEAIELMERHNPAYDANGIFARLEPGINEVAVRFLRGGQLSSASLLAGDGADDRVLRIKAIEQIDLDLMQKLVREAVALNMAMRRR